MKHLTLVLVLLFTGNELFSDASVLKSRSTIALGQARRGGGGKFKVTPPKSGGSSFRKSPLPIRKTMPPIRKSPPRPDFPKFGTPGTTPVRPGRPDWDGTKRRAKPPVVRIGERDVPKPSTRLRSRGKVSQNPAHYRTLDPGRVGNRVVMVDSSHNRPIPQARVRVSVERPNTVPQQPPAHLHLDHRHIGHHRIFLHDHYHHHDVFFYWWGNSYWCWHDGHYDSWNPYGGYFWCDHYHVHLDWGYPVFFVEHAQRHSYITRSPISDKLLIEGNTFLYLHGDHYDRSDGAGALEDVNFYCDRHYTYYEVSMVTGSSLRTLSDRSVEFNGQVFPYLSQYDLHWDSTQWDPEREVYGTYISFLRLGN